MTPSDVLMRAFIILMGVLYRPAPDLPVSEAKVEAVQPTPEPKTTIRSGRRLAHGWATYYAYHRGQAAAGPLLRKALGSHWRGQTVTVCGSGTCIDVRLTDFCACGPRHGDPTIIDLDKRDFALLTGLGAGILKVNVSR